MPKPLNPEPLNPNPSGQGCNGGGLDAVWSYIERRGLFPEPPGRTV